MPAAEDALLCIKRTHHVLNSAMMEIARARNEIAFATRGWRDRNHFSISRSMTLRLSPSMPPSCGLFISTSQGILDPTSRVQGPEAHCSNSAKSPVLESRASYRLPHLLRQEPSERLDIIANTRRFESGHVLGTVVNPYHCPRVTPRREKDVHEKPSCAAVPIWVRVNVAK